MQNGHGKPKGLGAFRRGLLISPFQIPILAYLFFQGFLTIPAIPVVAKELHVPEWSIWNFVIVIVIGAGLATFSRFKENERQEEFGLHLTALAVTIAAVIQIVGHSYGLGDEIAILIGCYLRIRVLRRNRKAEKVAIQIFTDNKNEEEPF